MAERKCDGRNKQLIAYVDLTGKKLNSIKNLSGKAYRVIACDCNRRFDDRHRSVVYPHNLI